MSAVRFRTGRAHQETTAVWARRRLADVNGRCFSSVDDQDGVLFADSVGLGKTWEALAAASIILYKSRPEKGRRHVLVLCPANLITKWEEELAKGSPFQQRLEAWCSGINSEAGRRYAERVRDTLSYVLPIRRGHHVATKLKYRKFRPLGGTYLVSHNLIGRNGRGLSALRREAWDVIIVDEAHNASARNALDAVQFRQRARTKLLLSATPFQLDPRQWNDLARLILKRGYRVFSRDREEVSTYVNKVSNVFHEPAAPGPTTPEVRAASRTLGLIAARMVPKESHRQYHFIRIDGTESNLDCSLDELDDRSLGSLLEQLRKVAYHNEIAFERGYLSRRLELANKRANGGKQTTYVATELRRLLARGVAETDSPRLSALETWARKTWIDDLHQSFKRGMPHKTIIFTSWVGDPISGEAALLRNRLVRAFSEALDTFRKSQIREWDTWLETGRRRLRRLDIHDDLDDRDKQRVAEALSTLSRDDLTVALVGKHTGCLGRVRKLLQSHIKGVDAARKDLEALDNSRNIEAHIAARALKRRFNDMNAALNPWSGGNDLRAVERYTGDDDRRHRDRAATAFRQIGPPWVLVASHVGSEGIDLHTYTHRIVHYDLEWNPARMEQREGRGDRVGRLIRDDLHVYYCLVPRTYDERMFHQLVARDRWHGVLLGRPAQALDSERTDAPIMSRRKLRKMRLQLAPR